MQFIVETTETPTSGTGMLRRVLLGGLAIALFVIPLAYWPGVTDYSYGKSITAMVLVGLLTILWSIRYWTDPRRPVRLPWISLPLVLLAVSALCSLANAVSPCVVLQSLALILTFSQLGLLIASTVETHGETKLLLFSLLASATVAAGYGSLQYAGVLPGGTTQPGTASILSFMGNRNYLGGFLSYTAFPSLILFLRFRRLPARLVTGGMILITLLTALIVRQTAVVFVLGMASIALAVAWLIFRPAGEGRRSAPWLAGLLAVAILAWVVLPWATGGSPAPAVFEPANIEALWTQNSGPSRLWYWRVGMRMLSDHPVAGIGLGHYKLQYIPYTARLVQESSVEIARLPVNRAAQAHNDFVQAAAELGGLGILAGIGLLGCLAAGLWQRIRHAEGGANQLDLILLTCGLLSFLGHAMVSFPAHLPASALAFAAITGLAWSRAYGDRGTLSIHPPRWLMRAVTGLAAGLACLILVLAVRDARADLLIGQGVAHLRDGDAATAETLFEQSLQLDVCPRQTYYYLANAEGVQGKLDEAAAHLEIGLPLFTDRRVYLEYADILGSRGRFDEAHEVLALVLNALPPPDLRADALYLAALLDREAGHPEAAIARLQELMAETPSHLATYIALGDLLATRGKTVKAEEVYLAGLERAARDEQRIRARLETAQTVAGTILLESELTTLLGQRAAMERRLAQLP